MSLRKGDTKKQGQKYQNRTAFKIVFDTKAIETHSKVYLDNLCPKCVEVIRWKMQYNKYKKATSESRCVKCEQKNIYKSYRHACDKCARAHKICAKCLQSTQELSKNPDEELKNEERIEKEMQDYLGKLKERTRRTLLRKIQKSVVSWDDEKKCFIEIETGVQLDNLKFKKIDEEDEDLGDDDVDDDFGEDDFEIPDGKQKQSNNEEGEIPVQDKPQNGDIQDSDDDDDDDDSDEDF